MILLDTNVLSEMRKLERGRADPRVGAWVADQVPDRLFLSVLTLMEVRIGILRAARRDPAQAERLTLWLEDRVLPVFTNRILPFDADIAFACAKLHVPANRPERDAMIAATALVHDLTVATRNTVHFAGTGVRLVDPWRA